VLESSQWVKPGRPPSKPHTLEYRWLNLLAQLWFKWRPSLPKSQLSIQLLASTYLAHSVFPTQSNQSLSSPTRHHETSRRLCKPLSVSFDLGTLVYAVWTRS
jgi:hypothetical protein